MQKQLTNACLVLLSVLFLQIGGSLKAQIIFSEDFDFEPGPTSGGAGTYSFPAGWALYNVDGLVPATAVSYVNSSWIRREDFSYGPSDSVAFSTSWYSPAGTADDWMISPPITLTPSLVLKWNAVSLDPSYPDGYEVWVSTTTQDVAGCLAGTMLYSTTSASTSGWTTQLVNLDSAGLTSGTVYFGFRNHTTDGFLLCIDDIIVTDSSCAIFHVVMDSVRPITCAIPTGYASTMVTGGTPPYTWDWSTSGTASSETFTSGGVYTVLVADSAGCAVTRGINITAPLMASGYDLKVDLVTGIFRPGFNTLITMNAYNAGCDPVSGDVSLVIDPMLDYVSSTIPPDVISGDTLKWNFAGWTYDVPCLQPMVTVFSPLTLASGDTVCMSGIITPYIGDMHPVDNVRTDYCSRVVASYDPNDKQVYPSGVCAEHYILKAEPHTYMIRFQNTGTAEAINVVVLDTLDDNLDINSLYVRGSSHAMHTEITDGKVLNFIFNDINLPDSTSNEPGSHGFIIFEINPKPALPSGTVIRNDASIYFDFNDPVLTNETFLTLVDVIPVCLPLATQDALEGFQAYPNPASSSLAVVGGQPITAVTVINSVGQVVSRQEVPRSLTWTMDVSGLPRGLYFLQVQLSGTERPQSLRVILE